MNKKFKY